MEQPRWTARDAGLALTVALIVAALGGALLYAGERVVGWTTLLLGMWFLVGIVAWTLGDGRDT